MIQYIIVLAIVGGFTAYFFGVPASLKVGQELTNLWIMAGLLVIFLKPLFGLVRFVRDLFQGITGFLRKLNLPRLF